MMRRFLWFLAALLFAVPAHAETNEVHIAQQTSAAFLQFPAPRSCNAMS